MTFGRTRALSELYQGRYVKSFSNLERVLGTSASQKRDREGVVAEEGPTHVTDAAPVAPRGGRWAAFMSHHAE